MLIASLYQKETATHRERTILFIQLLPWQLSLDLFNIIRVPFLIAHNTGKKAISNLLLLGPLYISSNHMANSVVYYTLTFSSLDTLVSHEEIINSTTILAVLLAHLCMNDKWRFSCHLFQGKTHCIFFMQLIWYKVTTITIYQHSRRTHGFLQALNNIKIWIKIITP